MIFTDIKDNENSNEIEGKENNGNSNPQMVDKMCRFAFTMSAIGVITIGICPAFAVMGIVIGAVFNSKGYELSALNKDRVKKARFLSIVALVLFVVDIVLLLVFSKYYNN